MSRTGSRATTCTRERARWRRRCPTCPRAFTWRSSIRASARRSPTRAGGELTLHVLRSDGFGNLELDATAEQLAALGASVGEEVTVERARRVHRARYVRAFAEVLPGALLLFEDSQRMAALAVNEGS